jgi:HK97 family phage major capsid protein
VKSGRAPGQRATFAAPEIGVKAATDTIVSPAGVELRETATDVDLTVVQAPRRTSLADLFGSGSISGNAIRYFIEGGLEGTFGTVGENGQKPQFSVTHPTPQIDALTKIAGWYNESDEILEDYAWLASSINNRALYELLLVEEAQLLNGNGTGANLRGLLNRTGVQTATATTATLADELFKAQTAVQTASGLTADAVVLNPADYQVLRLAKDANGQYYGGGMFQGQYGNGTLTEQPPVWGLRTVTTPAIAQGTAVVGAFRQAATIYRKGGVRVEATNSHDDDFTNNRITVRIEERLALAVRRPSAFVKVTISDEPAEG